MGWLGKMVGGTIGFALAGPLGAIAGAAFGHAFDTTAENDLQERQPALSNGETAQLTFFVAAFSMLAKLVRADGRIEKEEIETIERFMVEDLNLDPESRAYARNIFQTALHSHETFEQRTHKRLLDILDPTAKTVDELKKLNLPAGVDITIKI